MIIWENEKRNMTLDYDGITAYIKYNHFDIPEGMSDYAKNMSAWMCAYIILPKDTDEDDIPCHGGVTYTGNSVPGFPDIKPAPGMMVFGWDYAHAYDDTLALDNMLKDVLETLVWIKNKK